MLHLTSGFNRLCKDNCKTEQKRSKFWNLVPLILEISQYTTYVEEQLNCRKEKHFWALFWHICNPISPWWATINKVHTHHSNPLPWYSKLMILATCCQMMKYDKVQLQMDNNLGLDCLWFCVSMLDFIKLFAFIHVMNVLAWFSTIEFILLKLFPTFQPWYYLNWCLHNPSDDEARILWYLPCTKGPPFHRPHFQMHFREWKVLYFD